MGNTIKVVLISIFFLFLFHAEFTFAEEQNPKNYLVFKGGVYLPQHDEMKDYNDGFNGEIFYGRYFAKNFASEFGVGYHKSGATFNFSISGSPISGHVDDTIKVFDILYTLKGIYQIGNLELFAGPGVGVYFAKSYIEGDLNIGIPIGIPPGFTASGPSSLTSEWNAAFGYHFLVGGNYNVTPNWFLGVEGKYFWATTKDPIILQSVTNALPRLVGSFGTHLDGIDVTASLGWRF
jgi:opacity protein-like surface antigen